MTELQRIEQRLERIEVMLQSLLPETRGDISIDLCLSADDPMAALQERNKRLKECKTGPG